MSTHSRAGRFGERQPAAFAASPIEQLAASLKIALICEEKLKDPARAFSVLCPA